MKNKATLFEDDKVKILRSPEINFNFSKITGRMETWGKTKDEDPFYSPYGPLHADIEICAGDSCKISCPFCYKGNTSKNLGNSSYMKFDTFEKMFAKFPKTICQIAFGITSLDANPDMFPIYDFCRENGVIPNMTVSSADTPTDEVIDRVVKTCGAIAISVYGNQPKETRYNLIRRFIKAGMNQLNIHFMVSKSSMQTAYELCTDLILDPTLKGLNAVVFLGLKPKKRGEAFQVTENSEFEHLVNFCFASGIKFGFDSCSAAGFDKAVLENPALTDEQKKSYITMSERCESSRLSFYVNVKGEYSHCSFGEDMEKGWGISLLKEDVDFMKDVWHHENSKKFRAELKTLNCECPLFPEIRIENRQGNKTLT